MTALRTGGGGVHALQVGQTHAMLPMPIEVPSQSIRQYWHRRVARDPASAWLRGLIVNVLATA